MKRQQFLLFMQDQVEEIKRYREKMLLQSPETYYEQYAIEWIEKYSRSFKKNWVNQNHL
ncbi:MAG TPA: hypothetical protein PK771_14285 [Spirochaetota bacterium]|nr:hypothetical protein [Spirochaetota bacterium]